MYREKENRVYYTFPGGGKEKNETKEDCIIRECNEEFGIVVDPIKIVYTYEDKKSKQYFYLCKWITGDFGTGKGEEFEKGNPGGLYIPTMIDINDITNKPLMPPAIAKQFVEDYNKYGINLSDKCKKFVIND